MILSLLTSASKIWKPLGVSRVALHSALLKSLQAELLAGMKPSSYSQMDDKANETLCINVTPDETLYTNRCVRRLAERE